MGFDLFKRKRPAVVTEAHNEYVDICATSHQGAEMLEELRELLKREVIPYHEQGRTLVVKAEKLAELRSECEELDAQFEDRHLRSHRREGDIRITCNAGEAAEAVKELERALEDAGRMAIDTLGFLGGRTIVTTRKDMEEVLAMSEHAALKERLAPYDLAGQLDRQAAGCRQ